MCICVCVCVWGGGGPGVWTPFCPTNLLTLGPKLDPLDPPPFAWRPIKLDPPLKNPASAPATSFKHTVCGPPRTIGRNTGKMAGIKKSKIESFNKQLDRHLIGSHYVTRQIVCLYWEADANIYVVFNSFQITSW